MTTWTDSRTSHDSPYARDVTPSPPPSVRPATPTVGQLPEGTLTPSSASLSYTSIRRVPAPTTACSPSRRTPSMGDTSITSPGPVDQPA
ncbi:hypothetical protein LUX73_11100 [Actinomadura madurae]|nr:hypothetical protein [Actinomadura madurae]MCQ0005176.1 hypothetical protein [Actinomadura madurae]